MKIAVTGTPGTGKTTATKKLKNKYNVIHLNQLVKQQGYYTDRDKDRDSLVVDIDKLNQELPDKGVFEGHFSHKLDIDRIIILRCHPETLKERLKQKEFSQEKIKENAMAETIDVILQEAVETGKPTNEIDTTKKTPNEVAKKINQIIKEKPEPETGKVDWMNNIN